MTTLTDDELLAWLDGGPIQNDKANKLYCEAIAARFRELIALQEWQPIETAPKDGTHFLLYPSPYLGHQTVVGRWASRLGRWVTAGDVYDPTHWRPLPPPPKDG